MHIHMVGGIYGGGPLQAWVLVWGLTDGSHFTAWISPNPCQVFIFCQKRPNNVANRDLIGSKETYYQCHFGASHLVPLFLVKCGERFFRTQPFQIIYCH
jgi:hypothetical protein